MYVSNNNSNQNHANYNVVIFVDSDMCVCVCIVFLSLCHKCCELFFQAVVRMNIVATNTSIYTRKITKNFPPGTVLMEVKLSLLK